MPSLEDIKREGCRLFAAGDYLSCLGLYHPALQVAPLDYEVRLGVADCLTALGHREPAVAAYRATAWYCLRAGQPLVALVIARILAETLQADTDDILARTVVQYGSESELIGQFAARLNLPPGNLEVPLPSEPEPGFDLPAAAASLAEHCTDDFTGYPEYVHPIALLSELSEDAFRRVIETFVVGRLPAGAMVIREGEPGQSFFFVARGSLSVFDTDNLGRRRELARLGPNSIFGEMALLSAQPRTASVAVVSPDVDVLEVTRESLAALADELPAVAQALGSFTQERMLRNLMGHSPLFRPFNRRQQRELLGRFTSHDVAPGTDIIHQGEDGVGLFVVLSGEVEVVREAAEGEKILATLRAGNVFGEMALVKGSPTTARVTAAQPSTVLFLHRQYVDRMIAGIPQIRSYLESLVENRELETQLALSEDLHEDDEIIMI